MLNYPLLEKKNKNKRGHDILSTGYFILEIFVNYTKKLLFQELLISHKEITFLGTIKAIIIFKYTIVCHFTKPELFFLFFSSFI